MPVKEKHFLAYVAEAEGKAAINEEQRTIRFVISSGAIDRDNEIVEPTAVAGSIKEFAKNPVCLACHQHKLTDGMPPVVGSWDTDSFAATDKRCEMDLRFAVTKLGEEYWQLYKARHMRAVSIGFRVLDGHEVVESGKRFYLITKIELYEISCVPVGSNRDALSKLKGLGDWQEPSLTAAEIKAAVKEALDGLRAEMAESLDEIKCLLIPDRDVDLSLPGCQDDPSLDDAQQADAGQTLVHIANIIKQYKEY